MSSYLNQGVNIGLRPLKTKLFLKILLFLAANFNKLAA